MKTYHGYAKQESVMVEDHAHGIITALPHYVRYSGDGFLWGYNGSAPAELARCLLIDALGTAAWEDGERKAAGPSIDGPFPVHGNVSDLVEKLTGPLKDKVIASLDRYTDWSLTQNAILTFVRMEANNLDIPISEPLGVPNT